MDSIYHNAVRYREWNLLGDPELNVWTGPVKNTQVEHDSVILRKPQEFTVSVRVQGAPVPGAVVCISMDSTVYEYTLTNVQGQAILEINPVNTGLLKVVVTGRNLRPYIGLCNVIAKDVSCTAILAPGGVVDSGMAVTPVVKLFNYGSRIESYPVRFKIGTEYNQPETAYFHQPNTEIELVFPRWYPREKGSWVVSCSTELPNDVVTENDRDTGTVFVRVRDVEVARVLVPTGRYSAGSVITPMASTRNRGNVNATYQVWMVINNTQGERVYRDDRTVVAQVPGDSEPLITFSPCSLSTGGSWTVRCSVNYPFDRVPGNNIKDEQFLVLPVWGEGWQEATPMPAGHSGAGVKDGGWLAADERAGVIYAGKGNKTGDFYSYEPFTDTWLILAPIPPGREGRLPQKGARGVADGDGMVYLAKGNNTFGFWRYSRGEDRWEQLADIPPGKSGKAVRGGGDMVYFERNDTGFVVLLKGYYNDFLCYNTRRGTWGTLPEAPAGSWKKGSWLVYDGANSIYAHRANSEEMWVFDFNTNQWSSTPLPGIPRPSTKTGKSKKSKDGSAGIYYDGGIYALKGGNTGEFWCYWIADARWVELDTIPQMGSTGKRRRVKAGGDIAHLGGGVFFALKGNKTLEMWRYAQPVMSGVAMAIRQGVSGEASDGKGALLIPALFNPLRLDRVLAEAVHQTGSKKVRVWLLDITGRVVAQKTVVYSGATSGTQVLRLTPGLYYCRLETEDGSVEVKKMVVVR